jgi:hypothetical protein
MTVLILGAGASVPYGFSTGKKQLDEARMLTADQLRQNIAPESSTRVPALQAALHATGELSIDAMLPATSPILRAAKALIARDLYRVERSHLNPSREPTAYWYRTLYSNIPRRNIEEAAGTPLRIFTFNYDRSLDRFLWLALTQSFPDASSSEISAVCANIGPFHLHGQLGRLHAELQGSGDVVDYGGQMDAGEATDGDVLAAVEQIKLISETTANDPLFVRLREAISEADRLVFLGFAFHPENVGKLKLPETLNPQTQIFMSAFGITDQEMGHLKGKYAMSTATHGQGGRGHRAIPRDVSADSRPLVPSAGRHTRSSR